MIAYSHHFFIPLIGYLANTYAVRVGGSGAVVEHVTLFNEPSESGAPPAVAYDEEAEECCLVTGSRSPGGSLRGYRLRMPTGQAVAKHMGLPVLTAAQLKATAVSAEQREKLEPFLRRTPLSLKGSMAGTPDQNTRCSKCSISPSRSM